MTNVSCGNCEQQQQKKKKKERKKRTQKANIGKAALSTCHVPVSHRASTYDTLVFLFLLLFSSFIYFYVSIRLSAVLLPPPVRAHIYLCDNIIYDLSILSCLGRNNIPIYPQYMPLPTQPALSTKETGSTLSRLVGR